MRGQASRVSIWALTLALGPFVLLVRARRPFNDNSYLWHVTAGDLQLQTGKVLTEDPFSFTLGGAPWRTQSWLAELGYSIIDDVAGLQGGTWQAAFFGSLTFLVLAALALRRGGWSLGSGLYLGLTALVTLPFMNPRPVILSYLMLALVVLAVEERKLRWTLPLLVWVWAAVHGTFVLAFGVMFFGLLKNPRDRGLRSAFLVSGVASLLTAHGIGVLSILLEFLQGNQALDRIQEWQPPDLVSLPLWPVLVFALALSNLSRTDRLDWRQGVEISAWLVFGLTANRAIPVMWIALAPYAATAFRAVDRRVTASSRLPSPLVALVGAALLGLTTVLPANTDLNPERFPVEAAATLTGERVFHEDGVGGYLIYAQWPERLVYVDDRAELYKDHYVTYTDTANGLPVWIDEFGRWDFDQVLIGAERPLVQVLEAGGWTASFRDEHFVVLDPPS